MDNTQARRAGVVDRAYGHRDQIEVADSWGVVTGGSRSRDEQRGDPAQRLQLGCQLSDARRKVRHNTILPLIGSGWER